VALFQCFPHNYACNLSVTIAIESGAKIGEALRIKTSLVVDRNATREDCSSLAQPRN